MNSGQVADESLILYSAEFIGLAAATKGRTSALKKLQSEVGDAAWEGVSAPTVATASLLPEDAESPYYLQYHVSRDHKEDVFFFSMELRTKPAASPPRGMRNAHARGMSAEPTLRRLFSIVKGRRKTSARMVKLNFQIKRTRPAGLIAVPLTVEGAVLEPVGAEFKASKPGAGVHELRWAERGSSLELWISYYESSGWNPADLWSKMREKCLEFADKLSE